MPLRDNALSMTELMAEFRATYGFDVPPSQPRRVSARSHFVSTPRTAGAIPPMYSWHNSTDVPEMRQEHERATLTREMLMEGMERYLRHSAVEASIDASTAENEWTTEFIQENKKEMSIKIRLVPEELREFQNKVTENTILVPFLHRSMREMARCHAIPEGIQCDSDTQYYCLDGDRPWVPNPLMPSRVPTFDNFSGNHLGGLAFLGILTPEIAKERNILLMCACRHSVVPLELYSDILMFGNNRSTIPNIEYFARRFHEGDKMYEYYLNRRR